MQPGALDFLLEVFELLLVDGWNFTKMLLFLWPDLASVGLPWDLLVEALFVELFSIEVCRLLDYLVYQNPG